MSKKDFIITAIIAVLSVALIAVVIVSKTNDGANTPTTPSSAVPHDHDGDGKPDHDDSAHTSGGSNDSVIENDDDIDIGLDIEDQPDPTGGTTAPTTGNGGGDNAVGGNEIDMDDLINAGGNN